MKKSKQSGFTLVELAIVLVIIGLIVGGVLVGQDLIKAATLNKSIRQFSDTEAGATTFRNKYNALPGDYTNAAVTWATGTPTITGVSSSALGLGNGDGQINAVTTAAGGTATATLGNSGETAAFYPELYAAGYIKEQMNSVSLATIAATTAATNTGMFYSFAIGGTNKPLIVPTSVSSRNYLVVVGAASAAGAAGIPTWTLGLLPTDAAAIDSKLDDGNPTTGGVMSVGVAPVAGTAAGGAAGTTACYNTTGNLYSTAATTQQCNLSYRASF